MLKSNCLLILILCVTSDFFFPLNLDIQAKIWLLFKFCVHQASSSGHFSERRVWGCRLVTFRRAGRRFFTWPGFPLGWTWALCYYWTAQSSSFRFNFCWDLAGSRRSRHRAPLGPPPPVPWRKWTRYHWVVPRALTALFLFSDTLGEEVEVPCYCGRGVAVQTPRLHCSMAREWSVRDGRLSSPVSLFWYQAAGGVRVSHCCLPRVEVLLFHSEL